MSIQDIPVSNNQKKQLLHAITDRRVLIEEDSGEVVLNVAAYQALKNDLAHKKSNNEPIEEIVGNDVLDSDAEFIVFS